MTREEVGQIAKTHLGWPGAMISGSKSGYHREHPNNIAVFNANLIVEGIGKVWYGDLDVTKSESKLKKLAKELGKRIYVLREMDCRFDTESEPRIDHAVYSTDGTDA